MQKVKNQITVDFFTQKRNEEIEQINEKEKKIEQISKNLETKKQKQEVRELYDKFKNEENLMKCINDLVKQINFYSDRKIEIILRFGK